MIFLNSKPNNFTDINDVINSVESISKAMNNYGVAIVIIAAFLVLFIAIMIVFIINNTKMINRIIENNSVNDNQNQELVSKLVNNALESRGISTEADDIVESLTNELKHSLSPIEAAVLNDKKENNYHKDILGAYIDINMAFKDISRNTMDILNCDRIAIYVFHNGNKSLYGLPFFKMSCIHEWTTIYGNNTLRGKSHSDMPLHLYNDFIENLWSRGYYKCDDVEEAYKEDQSLKDFMAFSKSKSIYIVAIKNTEGAITGFVLAEFPSIERFCTDDSRDKFVRSAIDNMIEKVAPIVGSKYIYNKDE